MMKKIGIHAGTLLTCILTLSIPYWSGFSKNGEQDRSKIIKHSHKFHIEEVEASCTDCHVKTNESILASDNLLTSKAECANCHDVESEDNCTLCHFEDEETIQAFENPPRKILFSHKFHIETEGMECLTCHQGIEKAETQNSGHLGAMEDCAQCHNNERAPMECMSCHTDKLDLRPVSHGADFVVAHKNVARMDEEACIVCHTEDDCVECHAGGSLITFQRGTTTEFRPLMNISGSGTRGLVLPRVHELGFRATHGMQATGRSQECAVCHDGMDFCQSCHESEGVDVAGKPLWHGGADWGAIAGGVGTGGGRHGELAKRDIENCASCHSPDGDDATCVLCHNDFDGMRGTNPKTHSTSFADQFDRDDDFHNNDGAMCFACHTNTQVSGVGFCGYCHMQ